jgi:hypothetical protein
MVKEDNKKDLDTGDMVYFVPRLKNNMQKAAYRRFTERKLGPAKMIGILLENQINVKFGEMKIIVYGL